MTETVAGIEGLQASMTGPVIRPRDADYDECRKVWNANIDRRPAVIARCHTTEDVRAAVRHATGQGLEIAVRAGAHSMSGASVVDDGMMIDLSAMNRVSVDPAAKRARVGGGALLGDLDAATQEHGLAVPAGLVSHTGVAGLTLGGGMGWLTRRAGLTIDNLVSAEVVTADGQILRATREENVDLFWALRGGGGNFGIVTEFEFALHDVDPMIDFGMVFWSLDQGPEALRLAREVISTLPDDVNVVVGCLNAPPAPFVPEQHQFQPGYALIVTGFGSPKSHEQTMARLREGLPPLFDFVTPMPYVALQQMLDEANAWGLHSYDKGCYVEDLSDEVISALTAAMPDKTSPMSLVLFYRLDGAYSRVADDATAFSGGRSPRYGCFIIGVCPQADQLEAERDWVRSTWQALLPHALGSGAYVNSMTDFEDDRLRASYGAEKFARLARIKAAYDPGNVFHRNANIKPAS